MPSPDVAVGLSPQEQAYVDNKTQEIRNEAIDSNRLKNKFNEIKLEVEEAKEDLDRRVRSGNIQNIEAPLAGEVGRDLTSLKHRAKNAEVYLKEILKIFVNPTNSHLIPVPENNVGGKLVRELARQVPTGEIRVKDAPYLYLLVGKAINGEINNITQLENEFNKIQYLRVYNPNLFNKLAKVFVEAAKLVISEDEAKKKFGVDDGEKIIHIDPKEEEKFWSIHKKVIDIMYSQTSSITNKQFAAASSFLSGNPRSDLVSELQTVLGLAGVSNDEKNFYLDFYKKMGERVIELGIIGQYAGKWSSNLMRAKEEFTAEKIKKEFFIDADGNWVFDRTRAQKLKDKITKYYYEALSLVHSSQNRRFHDILREETAISYYFMGLNQIIHKACEDITLGFPLNLSIKDSDTEEIMDDIQKIKNFLDDITFRFTSNITFFANILHDFPFLARDANSQQEWANFLKQIYPSQIAEMFDDDGFMSLVRRVIPQDIRLQLVKNGNKYPSNLMGGGYQKEGLVWSEDYKKRIRDKVIKIAQAVGYHIDGEDHWKLQRAITYAEALGIMTLTDIETMGTANPAEGDFKSIHPLLPILFAKFNWGLGRGRPFAQRISKYLLGTRVELFPEERPLAARLWKKKRYVPQEFKDQIDKGLAYLGDELMDGMIDRVGINKGYFYELLSMVNFAASIISRGGWRVGKMLDKILGYDNVKRLFVETDATGYQIFDRENAYLKGVSYKKQWENVWKMAVLKHGGSSLWWLVGNRSSFEFRTLIAKQKGADQIDYFLERVDPGTYQLKSEGLVEQFDFVDFDGQLKKMSFFDIKNIRIKQLRAEAFFHHLQRNPGEFILILSQMVPELVAGFSERGYDQGFVFLDESELSQNKDYTHRLDSNGKEKIRQRKKILEERWGKEGFEILKQLRKWIIKNADELTRPQGGETEQKRKERQAKMIGSFIDVLTLESSIAFENMYQRSNNLIKDDKLMAQLDWSEIDQRRRIIRSDFQLKGNGQKIADLILDENNGLIKLITGLSIDNIDQFYDNFGDFDKAGKDNIFFRLADNWTLLEGDINPFSSDINHFEMYQYFGEVGEDVLARLHGDLANEYKELISKLGHIDEILLDAAENHTLEKIYDLHKSLYEVLSGAISREYAYRANYILAQVIVEFFKEHSFARDPRFNYLFPLGWFLRQTMGKGISLSKLATDNLHAYTMDTNAIRSYFLVLSRKGYIPVTGGWSEELLNRVEEATTKEFIIGDYGPKFLWFLIIFILLVYIKKAFEESEGKRN